VVLAAFALVHVCPARSAEGALNAREAVAAVVSTEPDPAFELRHHMLHGLDAEGLSAGAASLIGFLGTHAVPERMDPVDYLSLKNDVFDLLLRARIRVPELAGLLVDGLGEDSHPIWKDYCLQKIPETLGVLPRDATVTSELVERVRYFASGAHQEYTGTALIAAKSMSSDFSPPLVAAAEVAELAYRCAAAEGASPIDRVTALQIAAELRHPGTVPLAISILDAESDEPPAMLRVSAIAALGAAGDVTHRSLVERFRLSNDLRLRAAAKTALTELSTTQKTNAR